MDGFSAAWDGIKVEGEPSVAGETPPIADSNLCRPDSSRRPGTRLVAGRDLTWTDIHEQRPRR